MALQKICDKETDTVQGNRITISAGDTIVVSSGEYQHYVFDDVSGIMNERLYPSPVQVEVIE